MNVLRGTFDPVKINQPVKKLVFGQKIGIFEANFLSNYKSDSNDLNIYREAVT